MEKIVELIKYFVLSVVQGVGEVLPISSSGHLMIVRNIIGIEEDGVGLEIVLHIASLVSLFIYYRKAIFGIIKGNFSYVFCKDIKFRKDFIFVIGMIVSLIPTCLVGFFFNDYLDVFFKYPVFIGVFLVLNGLNLYLIRKKEGNKKIDEISLLSFFKIGIGQCLGLVPGFSRSGSALSMCYREKMDKEDSEKFTFLMLFPLVIGSFVLNVEDLNFIDEDILLLIICFLFTCLITFFSIGLLSKILKNNKLYYFSYYCVIIGMVVIFIG